MKVFFIFLIFVYLLSQSTDSEARFGKSELEYVLKHSIAIVEATAIASEDIEWESVHGRMSCGFKNKIRINESLSGKYHGTITIASREPLLLRNKYLLFLHKYKGDFATDVVWNRKGKEKESFDNCLSKLPDLKSNWLTTSSFDKSKEVNVLLSYWIAPPKEINGVTVEVNSVEQDGELIPIGESKLGYSYVEGLILPRRVVAWSDLRKLILHLLENQQESERKYSSGQTTID